MFDLEGARKEGYSDKEIADYLATEKRFDVQGARKEGYADTELVNYLTTYQPKPKFIDSVKEVFNPPLREQASKDQGISAPQTPQKPGEPATNAATVKPALTADQQKIVDQVTKLNAQVAGKMGLLTNKPKEEGTFEPVQQFQGDNKYTKYWNATGAAVNALVEAAKQPLTTTNLIAGDIVNALTLGTINSRDATIDIPLSNKRIPAPGITARRPTYENGEEIEVSPMAGELVGTVLPWTGTSQLITKGVSALKGAATGIKTAVPATGQLVKSVAERAFIQGATGATLGGVENAADLNERIAKIEGGAEMGAGFSIGADVAGLMGRKILQAWDTLRKMPGEAKVKAWENLQTELSDLLYGTGKFSEAEARALADWKIKQDITNRGGWTAITRRDFNRAVENVQKAKEMRTTETQAPTVETPAQPTGPTGKAQIIQEALPPGEAVKPIEPVTGIPVTTGQPAAAIPTEGPGTHLDNFLKLQQQQNDLLAKLVGENKAPAQEAMLTPNETGEPIKKVPSMDASKKAGTPESLTLAQAVKQTGINFNGSGPGYSHNTAVQHGLMGYSRKGGMALDDLATELQSKGVLGPTPDDFSGPGDFLYETLKGESARRAKEKEISLTAEEEQAIKEVSQELLKDGYDIEYVKTEIGKVKGDLEKEINNLAGPEAFRKFNETIDEDFPTEIEEELLSPEKTASELRPDALLEEPATKGLSDQKQTQPAAKGELFDTSKTFSLSGNAEAQGVKQNSMKYGEQKGERLFDVKKQNTDDLKDRLSGEKAKREYEESRRATPSGDADTGGYADLGDYQRHIHATFLESPEIVEFYHDLTGRFPKIKEKLRDAALGMHYGKGGIDLQKDIFKEGGLGPKVLAHEIGHYLHHTPEHIKGDVLALMSSISKYGERYLPEFEGAPGILTEQDRARFKTEAETQVKAEAKPDEVIVEEITREVPKYKEVGITREMIMEVLTGSNGRDKHPELYEYLAKATKQVKKEIAKKAFQDIIDERLKKFTSKEQIGVETVTEKVTKTIPGEPITKKAIEERARKLMEEEIAKRKLYDGEKIRKELEALTQIWKPFDVKADAKYTRYRHRARELYADAISVLFNTPELLKEISPSFYKGFFAYLEKKPSVLAKYNELQARMNDPEAVFQARQKRMENMTAEGKEIDEKTKQARHERTIQDYWTGIVKALWETDPAVYRANKAAKKKGVNVGDRENPEYIKNESKYVGDSVAEAKDQIRRKVFDPDKPPEGITEQDLHDYMYHNRVIFERSGMANPLGFTPKESAAHLAKLKETWGEDKYKQVADIADNLRKVVNERFVPTFEESGMFSDKVMGFIKDNDFYATFELIKKEAPEIGRELETHVGGKIQMQKGTLSGVKNVFEATIKTYLRLLRHAEYTILKKRMAGFLAEGGEIWEARRGKDGVILEPEEADRGLIKYYKGGKLTGFYTDKGIADVFNYHPEIAMATGKLLDLWRSDQNPLLKILGTGMIGAKHATKIFKGAVVTYNPLWQVPNMLIKDPLSTWKKGDIPAHKVVEYTIRGWIEGAKIWAGKESEIYSRMVQQHAAQMDRYYGAEDKTLEGDEMLQWGKSAVRFRNKVINPILKYLGALGVIGEKGGKIAPFMYHEKMGTNQYRRAHLTRRSGTPDILLRGSWHNVTNFLWPFSSIANSGWRGSYEAFKEKKGAYFVKWLITTAMPVLFYQAAKRGAFGDDIEEITQKAGRYLGDNYNIIPVKKYENGKAGIITIPRDYDGQVTGALLNFAIDAALDGGKVGSTRFGQIATQASSYNFNQVLGVGYDIGKYYLSGASPTDSWRGKDVLSEDERKAGGMLAAKKIGKDAWNRLGPGAYYKFDTSSGVKKETPDIEKALSTFPGTILGKFYRVTDAGDRDADRDIKETVQASRAERNIGVKDGIVEAVNAAGGKLSKSERNKLYHELKKSGEIDKTVSMAQFKLRVGRVESRSDSNRMIDAVASSNSNEEKLALLQKYKGQMAPDDYNAMLLQMKKEGLISNKLRVRAKKLTISE